MAPSRATQDADLCPSCGTYGKRVPAITIQSVVKHAVLCALDAQAGFRFCAQPACDLAYYGHGSEERVSRSAVRVRIGQKETTSPRPLCYCFGHSIEDIESEVAATGTSAILDEITEKCRQGLDRCEETNPQGSCCLGQALKIRESTQARRASRTAAVTNGGDAADCCAAPSRASDLRDRGHDCE